MLKTASGPGSAPMAGIAGSAVKPASREAAREADNPVAGEKYKIAPPDGRVKSGTLNQNGYARAEGIDPGASEVTFPNMDQEAWDKNGGTSRQIVNRYDAAECITSELE